MARIIILSGNVQEGHLYARKAGIHPSRYTNPASARSVEGVAPSEIHILPGFRRRRDTHAIMAAVKRSMRRYQGVKVLEIDERGPLTQRVLDVAFRYNSLRGIAALDAVAEGCKEQIETATLAELDEATEIVLTPVEAARLDAALAEEPKVIPELVEALKKGADLAEEPSKPEVKRRRSRCKVCQTLHFPGECPGPEIFE